MSEQDSFISHLIELRTRLMRAVGAVLVLFVIFCSSGRASGAIYDFLAAPLMHALPEGAKMIATGVITPFMVPMKVTGAGRRSCVALPYVLYQAWAFVAPGPLRAREEARGAARSSRSTVLFLLGVAFCYYFVFGAVFAFIHDFAPKSITPAPDIEAYFSFVITMFLAFGVTFEIPIVVIILVRIGHRVSVEAQRRAPLRDRRRLRGRRGGDPAGRAVAVHAGGADVPALRGRLVLARFVGAPARKQAAKEGIRPCGLNCYTARGFWAGKGPCEAGDWGFTGGAGKAGVDCACAKKQTTNLGLLVASGCQAASRG